MCGIPFDHHDESAGTSGGLTRRGFVAAVAGAGLALGACGRPSGESELPAVAPLTAVNVAPGLDIRPRSDWGADLPPKGPMGPEDVRFLLIHHTVSASPTDTVGQRRLIRDVYAFHTGSQKRWNDVAYNFFVGSDGTVWEGRAGSLAGPVVADATAGNQGFAQLVCLIGDFSQRTPTTAAQQSLVRLLAHLAVRHELSTWRDATATFVSRGSNRWRAGTTVTTSTISGHRDMTYTACPGAAAYALLPSWRRGVHPIVEATRRTDGMQQARRTALQAP